jgi:hypothetical protein
MTIFEELYEKYEEAMPAARAQPLMDIESAGQMPTLCNRELLVSRCIGFY